MILSYDGDDYDIGLAQDPLGMTPEVIQGKMRTASGITQVDNFSVLIGNHKYEFNRMGDDEYMVLYGFFINVAFASANEFDLTDDLGDTRTGRFVSGKLPFKRIATGADGQGLWKGSFEFEVTGVTL